MPETKAQERVMLGLRLDEPCALDGLEATIDERALERLVHGGLVVVRGRRSAPGSERSR